MNALDRLKYCENMMSRSVWIFVGGGGTVRLNGNSHFISM